MLLEAMPLRNQPVRLRQDLQENVPFPCLFLLPPSPCPPRPSPLLAHLLHVVAEVLRDIRCVLAGMAPHLRTGKERWLQGTGERAGEERRLLGTGKHTRRIVATTHDTNTVEVICYGP